MFNLILYYIIGQQLPSVGNTYWGLLITLFIFWILKVLLILIGLIVQWENIE